MVNKYKVHPDFYEACENMDFLNHATPEVFAGMNEELRKLWAANESDERVKVIKTRIAGYEGGVVDVQIIEPAGNQDELPAFIFFHAGAFLITGMAHHIGLLKEYATAANCKVFYIDYRLLPEHVYPTALYDCYALLEWVHKNAAELKIDRKRIVVGGDSAGGNLTAGVCLMARDRKGPAISAQMLMFPTTDARQGTDSMKAFTDTPVWNSVLSNMMWSMFFKNGDFGIRQYVSVVEADSYQNLPEAYVETAEFDCLRDEGVAYARLLEAAGIPVLLNETRQTMHCYDMVDCPVTRANMAIRLDFLRRIFTGSSM